MSSASACASPSNPTFAQVESSALEVSVCIANWNSRELLRRCLNSLFHVNQGAAFEVVLVDNASTDGSGEMVAREFPEVRLLHNRENRGFATASNQAAAHARGNHLLFLNNDTEAPPLTLRRLLDQAANHPEGGMFGPRLREPDGSVQISYRLRPTIAAMLHKICLIRWTGLFRRAHTDYRRQSFHPDGVRSVEVLLGSAVLLPRTVFESVGGWDERYRFGVEDIDLATQVSRFRKVIFVGDVEIIHHGRASSRKNIHFVAPSVATGYAQYFRKMGVSRISLFCYKLLVSLDAPVHLAAKISALATAYLIGDRQKARRRRAAAQGIWAFLRHELWRFWRA